MLDLRIIADGRHLPIFDLPALLGREQAAREVGDQIEALIAMLDALGGDPDVEPNGDERDASYPEANAARQAVIIGRSTCYEDAEQDDEPEDDDPAEDDDDDHGADDEGEPDEPDLRACHRDTVRQTRCTTLRMGSREHVWSVYRLAGTPPYALGMEQI